MSAISSYRDGQEGVFSSQAAGQCVDTLLEALCFENFVRARECAKEILGAGREHLVHHAAKDHLNNSFLTTLNLFEFLQSTHFQRDEELTSPLRLIRMWSRTVKSKMEFLRLLLVAQ